MSQELQPGEHVSWSYGAGQAKGQVVEKLTENKKLGARVFKASPDEPKYLVKSDTSGKEAVKKPEVLHKVGETDAEGDHDSPQESAGGKAEEDGHAESDASRQEVGAKEKRNGFKQRASNEEEEEGEPEELEGKVVDSGLGTVRESARAAKGKIKEAAEMLRGGGVPLDEGERQDKSYLPKKDELNSVEEEEEVVLPEMVAEVNEEMKKEEELDEEVEDGGGAEDKENQPTGT